MRKRIFVTGISTDVGKTIVASVIVEALKADYWKPIQSGDLEHGDADKIRAYISNEKTIIHPNSYRLKTPMSPNAAAAIDGIEIQLEHIKTPKTDNILVVEGAGGLFVPLNDEDTIMDLIKPTDKVILVAKHYLGSINHTLLSINALRAVNLEPFVIYSGEAHAPTEEIIAKMSQVEVLGHIEQATSLDKGFIKEQANSLSPSLLKHLI